jgi:hypothetical protein
MLPIDAVRSKSLREAFLANTPLSVGNTRKIWASQKISLKSDLRKTELFLRRLKLSSEIDEEDLLSQVGSLNLFRFIDEAVKAVSSSRVQESSVGSYVNVISVIHQRYHNFSRPLFKSLVSNIQREGTSGMQQVIAMQILCLLIKNGVYSELSSLSEVIVALLESDLNRQGIQNGELHAKNMEVIGSFCTHGAFLVAENEEKHLEFLHVNDPWKIRGFSKCAVRTLLKSYSVYLQNLHERFLESIETCSESLEYSTEKTCTETELRRKHKKTQKELKRIEGNCAVAIGAVTGIEIYKNHEAGTKKRLEVEPSEHHDKTSLVASLSNEYSQICILKDFTGPKKEELQSRLICSQFDKLVQILRDVKTKTRADAWCTELWSVIAGDFGAWKKKIARELSDINDLSFNSLRLYGRIAATFANKDNCFATILEKRVLEDFTRFFENKSPNKVELRLQNARYLGELCKFTICHPKHILVAVRRCLEKFMGYNIDVCCILFETCGQLLMQNPGTRTQSSRLLQTMLRLRDKKSVSVAAKQRIENAHLSATSGIRKISVSTGAKSAVKPITLADTVFYPKMTFLNKCTSPFTLSREVKRKPMAVIQLVKVILQNCVDNGHTSYKWIYFLSEGNSAFRSLLIDEACEEIKAGLYSEKRGGRNGHGKQRRVNICLLIRTLLVKRILPPSTILLVTKVISNNCFSQCHKIMGGSNNFDSSLYFEGIVLLCSLIPISANRSVRWKDFREKIYIILSPVKKYIECASNKDMLSLHFQGLFAKMCICYNV